MLAWIHRSGLFALLTPTRFPPSLFEDVLERIISLNMNQRGRLASRNSVFTTRGSIAWLQFWNYTLRTGAHARHEFQPICISATFLPRLQQDCFGELDWSCIIGN